MAGFALLKKRKEFNKDLELVKNSFRNRGMKLFNYYENDKFGVLYIGKLVTEITNFTKIGDNFILSQGTFIYKKNIGINALKCFYEDMLNKAIKEDAIFGHFNLVYSVDDNILIKSDLYNSLPIYYNSSEDLITSSFLTVCDYQNELTVNKDVIIENIITGCVFNKSQTYFKEINKVCDITKLEDIKLVKGELSISNNLGQNFSFKQEVDQQIHYINKYLNECKNVFKDGVDIGLSSGFDSRLILAILNKNFPNDIKIHTHWKKIPDNEIKVSLKLAEIVNRKLNMVPVKDFNNCSDEEKISITTQSFNFYDGQIRVNHSLFTQYRNISYRQALLGDANLGVSGLGGEQYRNDLSFVYNKYDFDFYIKEYVIDSIANFDFHNINLKQYYVDKIKKSISSQVSISSDDSIRYEEIRQYFNRLWVKSGPGHRNVAENQLSYYLSPFNDPYLSERALKIRKIGNSIKFQAQLIKSFSTSLAKVESDYGINFYDKNIVYRFKRFLLGSILMKKSLRSRLLSYKRKNKKNTIINLEDDFYIELIRIFNEYIQELKIEDVSVESNFFNRICGIGFLFKTYQKKLK